MLNGNAPCSKYRITGNAVTIAHIGGNAGYRGTGPFGFRQDAAVVKESARRDLTLIGAALSTPRRPQTKPVLLAR